MPTKSITIALEHFTTFGDLLKYLRRRVGLTQRELSIAVGYSDTQISRLEQNERMPDLATLTARFLPVLHIEDQPEAAKRLLELAATMRREDAPAAGLPPYKGLQFFDERDAELFFGRESLTNLLINRLEERLVTDQRFLAIIGASGSGKSSLVRAGLIPTLHWQQLTSGWPILTMTPTAHPVETLASVLARESYNNQQVRRIVDELMRHPEMLQEFITRIATSASASHAILIVDQFEELFTLCRSVTEQSAFVDSILTTAYEQDGIGLIVIVLRADFYAHCAGFSKLRSAISQHQEYIGPMTHQEMRRAIEEPAIHGHWELEPGLVDLLLHDVGADAGHTPEPGALPLLSHALLATWQRRRGRTMTLSGYSASGGVRGAIAETADAVFHDLLEPEQREIARKIFLRLTELGGETSTADTRRRVSINELVSGSENQQTISEVLLTLADARLITTDQDTAEVSHEALIREWPTLRGWLEEDREYLRQHRRLTEAAQEWDASGRDPGILYRGTRLSQATDWASLHDDDLNPLERDFLNASQVLAENERMEREQQQKRELAAAQRLAETEHARAEEQSAASRRLRFQAILLMIAFILAGSLAGIALFAWQQTDQANNLARSRELAAAAINHLQVDPERSVLLALAALEQADSLEARNALHQAVPELHQLLNIPAHDGGVPDVAYSPNGMQIASIGANGEVKLWDAFTGELQHTFDGIAGEPGGSVAYGPDGKVLAAAWATQAVVWDLSSGEVIARLSGQTVGTTIGYNLGVGQISFSPDGKRLAVANMDGASRIWELSTKKQVLSLATERTQPPKAIAYSPNGKLLATGGDEGTVWIWNAEDGENIFSLSLGGIIHSLSFSPDSILLTAGSEDGNVKIWETGTGDELLKLPRLSGLYDIAFLSDGRFATAGQDGTVRVWETATGQKLLTLAGPTSTVISLAGSPDGGRIASGAYDGSLRIWDASPGRELLTIPGHAGIVWNITYSPDGSRLASASIDGFTKMWDADTGDLLLTLPSTGTPGPGFTGLAFSPDGLSLATGSVEGTVTVWDAQTGERLTDLKGHTNYVVGLAFSPDGQRLASASWDGSAKVWDLESEQVLTDFIGHPDSAIISSIAFHPDGKTIFTGADDDVVYQWDADTGRKFRAFSTEGKDVYGIAISPDGKLLAAGDQDGKIHVWDVESGEKLYALTGHAGLSLRLAFNYNGSHLSSAGFDRLAKIWDVRSGKELFSLFGNTGNVFGVSFSPDSRRLATAGADGTIHTYTLDLNNLIDLAEDRLTRRLTDEECENFLHRKTCP